MAQTRPYTKRGEALAFAQAAAETSTDDCILWPFRLTTDGYGRLTLNGKRLRVNRLVLELAGGPPPSPTHEAAHAPGICHTPACVNPRHLRWATHIENMADKVLDGTHLRPDTAADPRGERNGKAKLTEVKVRAIRADERTYREIAADYGIDRSTVSDLKSRRRWAWLD